MKNKANSFIIECLTNLHVGSGDVNFNIVDKEVEKDITGYPVIHASGVKGAFRDAAEGTGVDVNYIFGNIGRNNENGSGAYKFFDARFLSRPLRVGNNAKMAYISTTTIAAINEYVETLKAFNVATDLKKIEIDFPRDKDFLVCADVNNIEGSISLGRAEDFIKDPAQLNGLKKLLGENFAIARDINKYSLPVIARNKLDNGKSQNLWYEEYVPHHSKFWLIVLSPDGKFELDINSPIQFGGNASVGYGYTSVTRM